MEGYHVLFNPQVHYNIRNDMLFIFVPHVIYSPEDYHRYISIKLSGGQFEFKDSFSGRPDVHEIKVLKHEPYEMNGVARSVLQSIINIEEARKDFDSKF